MNRRDVIKLGLGAGTGIGTGLAVSGFAPTAGATGPSGTLTGTFTDSNGHVTDLSGTVTMTADSGTVDILGATATPRVAYWSDPATWGGTVPASGADVTLPGDVTLDADVTVGVLTIPAGKTLTFDPAVSHTLQASGNVLVEGTLTMRPAAAALVHKLTFVGVNEAAYVGGGMVPLASDVGLWVTGAGRLDIAGTTKTAWVRAASGATAGSQVIALAAAPVGWQVGDSLTICPTAGTNNWSGYDHRTITAISGTVLTVSAPLSFNHPFRDVGGGFGYGAEVINLTRNAIIEGAPTGRAHVFASPSVTQTVDYAELRYLGPRQASGSYTAGVPGRYPLHFHMAGDGTRGSTVTGTVAHHCGNLAFVPHLSHGITFTGAVAHDTFDRAFWWDLPDISNDIIWQSCIASLIRSDPDFRGYALNGFTLGEGTGNKLIDCTVVGVLGNNDAGGVAWPEGATAAWEVTRVIAHNNRRHGFTVWQNTGNAHLSTDLIAADNGAAGILQGAYRNGYQWDNVWLYANKQASIKLDAMSITSIPLRFSRLTCNAAGLHANAIQLPKHTLLGGRPVEILGSTFTGHTGTTIASIPSSTGGQPDIVDLVECGNPTVSFNANSPASSVIRVQDGTTATQYTPAGAMSIAPFSSYTPVPPAPWTVLAAA